MGICFVYFGSMKLSITKTLFFFSNVVYIQVTVCLKYLAYVRKVDKINEI